MCKFLAIVFLCVCSFICCSESGYGQGDSTSMDSIQVENPAIGNIDSALMPLTDTLGFPGDLRMVPEKQVKAFQHHPDFAYANDPAYWKEEPPAETGFTVRFMDWLLSPGVRTSILILFLLVVAYAIYRLAKENSFGWFARGSKQNPDRSVTDESAEISGTDLDEAIRRYTESANFSLAIRYMYLKIIRDTSEKKGIRIKASSTNAEIANAFQNSQQARDFRYLATAYEYIFYGGFVPGQEQFNLLRQKMEAFHQSLMD